MAVGYLLVGLPVRLDQGARRDVVGLWEGEEIVRRVGDAT
jgi:hypothetical protein